MATYTPVSLDDLQPLWARYDLPRLRAVHGIAAGTENSNYWLETDGARYILTLYEARVNAAELPFFMGLMQHLSAHGVPCPQPLADRSGQVLQTLCGKPAALTTFLTGASRPRWQPVHCYAMGQALAAVHVAAADYPVQRDNRLGFESWAGLFAPLQDQVDRLQTGLAAMIGAELAAQQQLQSRFALPRGLIHADLFPDNVFFTGDQLTGVIDFYFACSDALAYDLAICLNAWCFEDHVAFNITKARALLAGYQSVRRLTPEERQALPLLCRGASLRFLLTRLENWLKREAGAAIVARPPLEYLKRLTFHQQAETAAAYGIND